LILEGNVYAANLLGCQRDQLSAHSFFDFLQDDLDKNSSLFDTLDQFIPKTFKDTNQKEFPADIHVQNLKNNLFWILIHPQKSQNALERNERLLNETQKLAKMGAWDYDLRTQTTYWTDELYRLHGYSPEKGVADVQKVIADSLDQFEPEGRVKVQNAFEACIAHGTPYDIESEFYKTTGEKIYAR